MAKRKQQYCFWKRKAAWLAGLLVLTEYTSAVMPVMAAEPQIADSTVKEAAGYDTTVQATGVIPDRVAAIFDAEFYKAKYPDVAAVIGDDPQALLLHFWTYGLKEGRVGSPLLDIAKYRMTYPDLAAAFGDNWDLYVEHYFRHGIAEGRSNGIPAQEQKKVYVKKNGTAYDSDGNVLVPWDVFVEDYLSLEELKQRCGSTLILLQDEEGNVTFVGGNFSDVAVTDADSAMESLHCMMKLLNFPEDTATLFLTHVNVASDGQDIYYRFSAQEKDEIAIWSDSDIVVGVDSEGKVICLSSSSGTRYYHGELSGLENDWTETDEKYLDDGYHLLSEEPILKYNDNTNQYAWVKYYAKDGMTLEVYKPAAGDSDEDEIRLYKGQGMPTEDSYSFDYFFKNDIEPEWMEFTNYFGETVSLPVAQSQNGYYILDKERNIIGMQGLDGENDPMNYQPYYFDDPAELPSHFVSALQTLQSSYDHYQSMGLFAKPTALLVGIDMADTEDNAWCSYDSGALFININNHIGNAAFDGVSHELGHGVLAMITGDLKYRNATGAINESYADILGNLLEMMNDDGTIGEVDHDTWYIEEAQRAVDADWNGMIRNMTDPNEKQQPYLVGGKYYVINTDEENINDHGGVHTNNGILNHICYRMYADAQISLETLFSLWYDTLHLLTEDSDYKSMQGYMEYVMRRHGIEEQKIQKVHQYFEEANVAAYADTWDELEAAEGVSKVKLVFRNLPPNVKLGDVTCSLEDESDYNLYKDSQGVHATILEEGASLAEITLDEVDDPAIGERLSQAGSTEYVVLEEDGTLVVDYYDFLAAAMTEAVTEQETVEIPEEYAGQFLRVTIGLLDSRTQSAESFTILLNKKLAEDEDVDVIFQIKASGECDDEVLDEDSVKLGYTDVILRQNAIYTYTVSVTAEDQVWTKEDEVNVAEIEDDCFIITFDPDDNWSSEMSIGDNEPEVLTYTAPNDGMQEAAAKQANVMQKDVAQKNAVSSETEEKSEEKTEEKSEQPEEEDVSDGTEEAADASDEGSEQEKSEEKTADEPETESDDKEG